MKHNGYFAEKDDWIDPLGRCKQVIIAIFQTPCVSFPTFEIPGKQIQMKIITGVTVRLVEWINDISFFALGFKVAFFLCLVDWPNTYFTVSVKGQA